MKTSVFSDDIKALRASQKLDMKKMSDVLSKLPGDRNRFTIQAQTAELKPGKLSQVFLKKLEKQFQAHKLDLKYFSYVSSYLYNRRIQQPLSSRLPWTLSYPYNDSVVEAPKNFEECCRFLFNEAVSDSTMKVLGTSDDTVLLKYYQDEADAVNQNNFILEQLMKDFESEGSIFLARSSMSTDVLDGVKRITYESSYKTQSGIFGYDEHELLNRKYYFYKRVEDYLFVEKSAAGQWLTEAEKLQRRALTPAVQRLLEQVPENTTYVNVSRLLQHTDGLLKGLTQVEKNLRDEIDVYLKKVNEIAASALPSEQHIKQIEKIKMPYSVLTLNKEGDKYRATLPGYIKYPRPVLMDQINPLFNDYLKIRDNHGGSLVYSTQNEGQIEIAFIQRTDALAALVKSLGSTFMKNDTPVSFLRKISRSGDGRMDYASVVIYNPNWSWIFAFLR